jgi:hypothetical protein
MRPSVADTGLTWDQVRLLPADQQSKATQLSREMYAHNKTDNYLQRESVRRRLTDMLRRADGV